MFLVFQHFCLPCFTQISMILSPCSYQFSNLFHQNFQHLCILPWLFLSFSSTLGMSRHFPILFRWHLTHIGLPEAPSTGSSSGPRAPGTARSVGASWCSSPRIWRSLRSPRSPRCPRSPRSPSHQHFMGFEAFLAGLGWNPKHPGFVGIGIGLWPKQTWNWWRFLSGIQWE